jgi:hypothetical protein
VDADELVIAHLAAGDGLRLRQAAHLGGDDAYATRGARARTGSSDTETTRAQRGEARTQRGGDTGSSDTGRRGHRETWRVQRGRTQPSRVSECVRARAQLARATPLA